MVERPEAVRALCQIWRYAFPEQASQRFDVGVAGGRVYWLICHMLKLYQRRLWYTGPNSHQFPVLDGYWRTPIRHRSRSKMRLAGQKMS